MPKYIHIELLNIFAAYFHFAMMINANEASLLNSIPATGSERFQWFIHSLQTDWMRDIGKY